jgi:hypothetical protein
MRALRFLVPFLLAVGLRAQTVLQNNVNIAGTESILSGGNLSFLSGSTVTFGISGTTNSLLYITNSGGNVGTVGLGSGLSISGGNLVAASSTSHNPTASVGPTAVNGSASTFMTSDSAPAINLAGQYNWTALHTFTYPAVATSGKEYGVEVTPTLNQRNAAAFSMIYGNETVTQAGTGTQDLEELAVGGTDKWQVNSTGTVTTGIWNGTTIVSGYGGTGQSTFAIGSVLEASSANTWTALAPGLVNYVLTSGGTGVVTSYQSISTVLSSLGTVAQGDLLYYNGTSWVFLAPGTSGQVLSTTGAGSNPAWINNSTPPGSTTAHDVVSYSNTAGALEDTGYMNFNTSNVATVSTTSSNANGSLYVNNAVSGAGNNIVASFLGTGTTGGGGAGLLLGVQQASNNLGELEFVYSSNGSTSNELAVSFYGTANRLTLTAAGAFSLPTLSTAGAIINNSSGTLATTADFYTAYLTGTAYTMTGSAAAITGGTTSPSVTLTHAGTYLLRGGVVSEYVGATYAANQTATYTFYRTNNTAAAVGNSTVVELRVLTTLTDNAGTPSIPEYLYTATAGDIITIYGNVSATPSAGSVTVNPGTWICAERKY